MPHVYLKNVCPYCDHPPFKVARPLIQHLKRYHSQDLPARNQCFRRPSQWGYCYVPSEAEADESHAACPSCWQHFPEQDCQAFIAHLETKHVGAPQAQIQADKPLSMEAETAGASGENPSTVVQHKDDASTERKLVFLDALDNLVVAVKRLVLNGE